ncbi:MAG TPA: peptidoglycan-binding protein, partial [Marmoricola sp.]|nr:peptidoglycan-binding protein [Marmoricola sp.]
TIGAMVLALLLGSFALAYGVGEASAQLSSREPRAALVQENPTPSPTPATSSERIPTVKPTPTATARPKPKPALHAGPTLLGPQTSGDRVRDLQARLKQIAWYFADVTGTYGPVTTTAVKGFQAKREIPVTGLVDQRTLDRLNAMTRTPTDDELHNIAIGSASTRTPLDARCLTGRALCIDKTSRTLRWVVDGKVRSTLAVRFGASYSPTREGLFHVGWKSADHVSKLYGSAMPFSMFFSGGQAVHYSSDFAARGYYGASHGCVNVRDYDGIRSLFSQVVLGDKVVIYWS